MSDPTRFDLDDRQRAILAEMGVRVWWPQRTQAAADAPVLQANDGANQTASAGAGQANFSRTAGVRVPTPAEAPTQTSSQAAQTPLTSRSGRPGAQSGASAPSASTSSTSVSAIKTAAAPAQALAPLPAGIADMGWPALQEAVNGCQACALCNGRKTPILGSGHALPASVAAESAVRWMVVGDSPSQADDQQGLPFTGPEGQLLDNMLMAVGVRRQTPEGASELPGAEAKAAVSATQPVAYLTHAVKCRTSGRNPVPAELATCAAYLSRQVALVQPHIILAMGRFAIQSLLGSTEPMGKLRGRVHDFQGVPVVVTFPPDALLRNAPEKAKAWEDLVLALGVVKPR